MGPAFAGPDRDRNFKREDSRRGDARSHDHHRRSRHDDNRGHERKADRGPSHDRRSAVKVVEKHKNVHRNVEHRRPAVKIVQKPVVVHREIRYAPAVKVVNKPVVVHREVVRRSPVVRTDYHRHNVHYGPPARVIVVPERRRYRNVWVTRHYGHRYHGYGHYRHDNDAYQWLAFTAISVALIGALSEAQQRSYEDAQIRAAAAPIGQAIYWNDAGAAGSVTAVREGTSSQNRYCREFQQTVTVGGNSEQAYGTACRQPDGAWEIVQQPNF
ncbi:MAG: hypothetical protein GEU87_20180 [Alphaproteobacteria bacterium]|nr:hypothetical protein [Alphaproteobacteria bacterium]